MEIKDQLEELYLALKEDDGLRDISIKSFKRPETLDDTVPSIVIIPLGPPRQSNAGSDGYLTKSFMYQINVESIDRKECKLLQAHIEQVLLSKGFYQMEGGLDEWIPDLQRYADARTYKGRGQLYVHY
ncbi:hypothetical protein IR117_01245 [Streptococcus danieliae]|nr:hypothetical protein [Streptococcus danieliae]